MTFSRIFKLRIEYSFRLLVDSSYILRFLLLINSSDEINYIYSVRKACFKFKFNFIQKNK